MSDIRASSPQLSLKRQLLLWLLLPQLMLWLVGGTLAYRIALSYAEKGIDQSLTQSVRSLARQVKPIGSGLLIDFPRAAQAIIEEDPEDKVSYMVSSPPGQFILGNASLPEPPASTLQGLSKTGEVVLYQAAVNSPSSEGQRNLRLAVMELEFGEASSPQRLRVQVAKSLTVRDRIARELVYDMLVPLVILGLVLGVLVYAGIARGLQPLARLQDQLQAQSTSSSQNSSAAPFSPIALQQAPQEVHQLAAAVNQLLAAVERSLSQEKRFLNDAAHQLRTPLAGLQAQLDLALTERNAQALQERLSKVRAAVQRTSHLVHQLLKLARSETDVPMQPVNLLQLARSLAQEVAPAAIAAGIDFGFEAPEDYPSEVFTRPANATLLHEALANLIDNAVRYAGSGATVTLRVKHDTNQKALLLEVEDNGPGVHPDQLPHIFERFFRASDTPEGAGLGLAIVKEIAQRHGGSVSAQALLPQGLKVQIRLV